MLVAEIVNSCSNDKVAAAALASIGGVFAADVEAYAAGEGLSAGKVAARIVRRFSQIAEASDFRALRQAIAGADQPVLAGLRLILEAGIRAAEAEHDGSATVAHGGIVSRQDGRCTAQHHVAC